MPLPEVFCGVPGCFFSKKHSRSGSGAAPRAHAVGGLGGAASKPPFRTVTALRTHILLFTTLSKLFTGVRGGVPGSCGGGLGGAASKPPLRAVTALRTHNLFAHPSLLKFFYGFKGTFFQKSPLDGVRGSAPAYPQPARPRKKAAREKLPRRAYFVQALVYIFV